MLFRKPVFKLTHKLAFSLSLDVSSNQYLASSSFALIKLPVQ